MQSTNIQCIVDALRGNSPYSYYDHACRRPHFRANKQITIDPFLSIQFPWYHWSLAGDQVAQQHEHILQVTIPRVTVQCVHVILMNVLNRSSSSALDLQYDNTMETRCSERGLIIGQAHTDKNLGIHRSVIGTNLYLPSQGIGQQRLCSSAIATIGFQWRCSTH